MSSGTTKMIPNRPGRGRRTAWGTACMHTHTHTHTLIQRHIHKCHLNTFQYFCFRQGQTLLQACVTVLTLQVKVLSLSQCCGIWSRKTHLGGHVRQWSTVYYASRSKGESVPNKDPNVSERPSFIPPTTWTGYVLATSLLHVIGFYNK